MKSHNNNDIILNGLDNDNIFPTNDILYVNSNGNEIRITNTNNKITNTELFFDNIHNLYITQQQQEEEKQQQQQQEEKKKKKKLIIQKLLYNAIHSSNNIIQLCEIYLYNKPSILTIEFNSQQQQQSQHIPFTHHHHHHNISISKTKSKILKDISIILKKESNDLLNSISYILNYNKQLKEIYKIWNNLSLEKEKEDKIIQQQQQQQGHYYYYLPCIKLDCGMSSSSSSSSFLHQYQERMFLFFHANEITGDISFVLDPSSSSSSSLPHHHHLSSSSLPSSSITPLYILFHYLQKTFFHIISYEINFIKEKYNIIPISYISDSINISIYIHDLPTINIQYIPSSSSSSLSNNIINEDVIQLTIDHMKQLDCRFIIYQCLKKVLEIYFLKSNESQQKLISYLQHEQQQQQDEKHSQILSNIKNIIKDDEIKKENYSSLIILYCPILSCLLNFIQLKLISQRLNSEFLNIQSQIYELYEIKLIINNKIISSLPHFHFPISSSSSSSSHSSSYIYYQLTTTTTLLPSTTIYIDYFPYSIRFIIIYKESRTQSNNNNNNNCIELFSIDAVINFISNFFIYQCSELTNHELK